MQERGSSPKPGTSKPNRLPIRFPLYLFVCILVLALPGSIMANAQSTPNPTPIAAPFENWQTTQHADHPLVGKIYSVNDASFLTPDELIKRLARERFVMLGEIHDNKDHHLLQAWIIARIAASNRKPAIVMEQIRNDQAVVLKLYMSGKHKTAARLGPAIGWEKSGWPKWEHYQPIAHAAISAGLPINAGDTNRPMNRKVGKLGFKALERTEVEELGLQQPLGAKLDKALTKELVVSHCNMMPAKMMGPMALVQRYRDAHLARAMLRADLGDGSILIAGNGHVRTDRAAPWYLREGQVNSTSLMIVEADKDARSVLDLIPLDPDAKATADYVWVTPGAKRDDPCEKLRKQFGGKHGKSGKPASPKE